MRIDQESIWIQQYYDYKALIFPIIVEQKKSQGVVSFSLGAPTTKKIEIAEERLPPL